MLQESLNEGLGSFAHDLGFRSLKVTILPKTENGVVKLLSFLHVTSPDVVIASSVIWVHQDDKNKTKYYVYVEKVDTSGSGIRRGIVRSWMHVLLNNIPLLQPSFFRKPKRQDTPGTRTKKGKNKKHGNRRSWDSAPNASEAKEGNGNGYADNENGIKMDEDAQPDPHQPKESTLESPVEGSENGSLEVQLHLCSKSHPQYLFPRSHANPKKVLAPDYKLCEWWKNILETVTGEHHYWFIPDAGVDMGAEFSSQQSSSENGVQWTKGYPYTSVSEIPQIFSDDPKARLLKSEDFDKKNSSLSQFWGRLAIGQECGIGKVVCFFVVTKIEAVQVNWQPVSQDEWTKVHNEMTDAGDYRDEEHVLKSSEKLVKQMKRVKNAQVFEIERDKTKSVNIASRKRPPTVVNDISNLLKKRKAN